MEIPLQEDEIKSLRKQGLLSEQEIAVRMGDRIVAINVVSNDRRPLGPTAIVESKRLLKG